MFLKGGMVRYIIFVIGMKREIAFEASFLTCLMVSIKWYWEYRIRMEIFIFPVYFHKKYFFLVLLGELGFVKGSASCFSVIIIFFFLLVLSRIDYIPDCGSVFENEDIS
jgi:hypothetical protein